MSVAASEAVPEPAGGGTGTRPRGARACAFPARATRMDRRPLPRLRPLAELLGELGASPVRAEEPAAGPVAAGGPAWDAALEAAAAQVGPLAVGLLTATAEVLDGRRPVSHLARRCPSAVIERMRGGVARAGARFPRGARVRGLRLCPVVGPPGPDGSPGLAVEVAAALCGDGGRRARAAAARFELDAAGAWCVTELTVL